MMEAITPCLDLKSPPQKSDDAAVVRTACGCAHTHQASETEMDSAAELFVPKDYALVVI